jgi:hypothetical protein
MNKILWKLCLICFAIILSCSDEPEPEAVETCTPGKITQSLTNLVGPSSCFSQDVSFTISASGGTEPYRYEVNTGSITLSQSSAIYTNLFPGKMSITVRDKLNCSSVTEFNTQLIGTSTISYQTHIVPILNANCNLSGCHNGDLGTARDWRSLSAIQQKLNNFQRILALKKMPPPPNALLSQEQTNNILCWIAYGAPDN